MRQVKLKVLIYSIWNSSSTSYVLCSLLIVTQFGELDFNCSGLQLLSLFVPGSQLLVYNSFLTIKQWATLLEHFCNKLMSMELVDLKTWDKIRRENPPSEQSYQRGYSYADYQQFLESLGVFLHFDCSKLPKDDSFIIHQPSCSNRLSPVVSGGQFLQGNVAWFAINGFLISKDFRFGFPRDMTSWSILILTLRVCFVSLCSPGSTPRWLSGGSPPRSTERS